MVDSRFETLSILKLVVKQALDGDVQALRWLEDHDFLTVHREAGKIWMSWNQEMPDGIFFENDEGEKREGQS